MPAPPPDEAYQSLGQLLLAERQARGLTLRAAARALGMHHNTLALMENGVTQEITALTCAKLSVVYRISLTTVIRLALLPHADTLRKLG